MRLFKISIILMFTILLTSCYDNTELDERGLVITIGVDKPLVDDINKFRISLLIPNTNTILQNSEQGSSSDEPVEDKTKPELNKNVKTTDGNSISTTMSKIDYTSSQNLYYGHTKVCIINEDILKETSLLKQTLDGLERNKELSRKLILLASKERAEDILKNSDDKNIIGLFINDLYKNNKFNLSYTLKKDLENVIQDLLSTGNTIIPQISTSNNEIKLEGLAIIKDYKLVDWLDAGQTRSLLWVIKDEFGGQIYTEFNDVYIPLEIDKKKVKITLSNVDSKIQCNISLKVKGTVSEYSLSENITVESENYNLLENSYEKAILKEILNGIDKIKSIDTDVFELNELARKRYYNMYNEYFLNNPTYFQDISFNVDVDVLITSSGSIK